MNFDYEISQKDDLITIIPYSESETEIDADNFDITITEFWGYVVSQELNHYCHDYHDPRQSDGHGQDVGIMTFDEYFELDYSTIKKDLKEYLIRINKYPQ
jgi:hypothetical protein